MVSITWGEAALIVGLYLAPAGWLPAATLLGAGLAWSAASRCSPTAARVLEVVRIAGVADRRRRRWPSRSPARWAGPCSAPPTPALAARADRRLA